METIKCKSCGAVQEVSNDASSCNFCGSAIELQQSKDFYKEIVKSEFGNFLMMAETAEEATNYEEASKYYNKILEKDTTYSDAWLGKGNCLIYSSKIGDIKMKEALTYWKNAIKFAEHQDPMKLRVGKEINNVVNTFFPNLLNHYNEFSGLDDSYVDLAGRFLILEGAIDYATELCPNEPEFFQTGFDPTRFGAPRAGGRACGGRLRPCIRQGRCLLGRPEWAGCHQPRDRPGTGARRLLAGGGSRRVLVLGAHLSRRLPGSGPAVAVQAHHQEDLDVDPDLPHS